MKNENLKIFEVLLIDDSEADSDLVKEAMVSEKIIIHINVVRNGEEAMAFLRQQAPYDNAKQPNLILLDLNLPKKDGREVLHEVKADSDLCLICIGTYLI